MIDTMAHTAESNRIDEIRRWNGKRVIEMAGRRSDEVACFHFVCHLRVPLSELPKLWRKIDGRTYVPWRGGKKKETNKYKEKRTKLSRSRFSLMGRERAQKLRSIVS